MTIKNTKDPNTCYQQLRQHIVDGAIPPGSKLSINHLTQQYETSAAPIREALSRLDAEGLVIRKGQRGYWAAPVSLEEFLEVSRLRVMLEVDALAQSIRLGDLNWEANIAGARHREITIKQQAIGQREAMAGELIRENRLFHLALISQCPSQWQLRFLSTLYDQSERYRRLSLIHQSEQTTNDTQNTAHQDDHKLIMEAAFKRDEKTACELLKAHIEHSNQRIIETVF